MVALAASRQHHIRDALGRQPDTAVEVNGACARRIASATTVPDARYDAPDRQVSRRDRELATGGAIGRGPSTTTRRRRRPPSPHEEGPTNHGVVMFPPG